MFFTKKYKKVDIIKHHGYEIPIFSNGEKKYAGYPQPAGHSIKVNRIFHIESIGDLKRGIDDIIKYGDDVDPTEFFPGDIGTIRVGSSGIHEGELNEDKVTYGDDKVNEFLTEAVQDMEHVEKIYNMYITKIGHATLGTILEDYDASEKMLDTMREIENLIYRKHTKYDDVVSMYQYGSYPDNITQLDEVTEKINNRYYDFSKLTMAYESLLEVAEKLKDLYRP